MLVSFIWFQHQPLFSTGWWFHFKKGWWSPMTEFHWRYVKHFFMAASSYLNTKRHLRLVIFKNQKSQIILNNTVPNLNSIWILMYFHGSFSMCFLTSGWRFPQVLTTSWLNGRKPRELTASEKLRMVNLAAWGCSESMCEKNEGYKRGLNGVFMLFFGWFNGNSWDFEWDLEWDFYGDSMEFSWWMEEILHQLAKVKHEPH